jgi:predicted nucleic acid-binding protein
MTYLLDTNVVSEWIRPQPNPNLVAWLDEVDEDRLHVSVATFAEIRHGIELMAPGRRRQALMHWLDEELADRFADRILPIDRTVAGSWGVVMARASASGASMATMDGFLAATAAAHNLTLVTRDAADFRVAGVAIFNPWEAAEP